ncbi:MAG: hypothetical protein QOH96_4141 [Blastocatellia bacterium]|nr:hypothetical protein [Blastocatellia bacterium]
MYCPKCGQQQPSSDVRFCNRCGLGLTQLSLWLEHADKLIELPEVAPSQVPKKRRKRMRQGAKLMFLSAVLFPFAMMLGVIFDSPGPLVIPFTVFLAGLSWTLYSRLFIEDLPQEESSSKVIGSRENRVLSAGGFPGGGINWSSGRVHTAEIAQPPSVTERTTVLLEKDRQSEG